MYKFLVGPLFSLLQLFPKLSNVAHRAHDWVFFGWSRSYFSHTSTRLRYNSYFLSSQSHIHFSSSISRESSKHGELVEDSSISLCGNKIWDIFLFTCFQWWRFTFSSKSTFWLQSTLSYSYYYYCFYYYAHVPSSITKLWFSGNWLILCSTLGSWVNWLVLLYYVIFCLGMMRNQWTEGVPPVNGLHEKLHGIRFRLIRPNFWTCIFLYFSLF